MIRIAIVMVMILCGVMYANAETYTWTDDKGVVNFTDDPGLIPAKYRVKAKKGEDITVRNPKVQQGLKEQEERARQDEINRPRIVPSPDYVPRPQQPTVAKPPETFIGDLPPGRTKSQRIRDNIERRNGSQEGQAVGGGKY